MIGIYKITNQINGKCYIGQSTNIQKRLNQHKRYAFDKSGASYNKILYKAIRKYGIENFTFEVLEECSQELLNEQEIYWIDYYNSYNEGYNATYGGEGKRYDYKIIYEEWQKGLKCKEIKEKLNISNVTITNALRTFGISENEVMSRSCSTKKQYLALSEDGKPLKIFDGARSIVLFFNLKESKANDFLSILNNGKSKRFNGYYWKYYEGETLKEITDEEFFKYQMSPKFSYTEEQKLSMSLKRRKAERPDREELKFLIRNKSFVEIGKQYGVSDNAVRRWCDQVNLPRKKRQVSLYTNEEWDKI